MTCHVKLSSLKYPRGLTFTTSRSACFVTCLSFVIAVFVSVRELYENESPISEVNKSFVIDFYIKHLR